MASWQDELAELLRELDHPDQARLHFNLGLAYLATGQPERARDTYNAALQLAQAEEIADAQNGLAELLKKLPQRPAGADAIEQMLHTAQPAA